MTNAVDIKPTDGKLISGYLVQYTVSNPATALWQLMKPDALGTDPSYYFAGVDAKIMRHLVAHNGLGDWATFTAQNADVTNRLEDIAASVVAIEFTNDAVTTWAELTKEQHKGRGVSQLLTDAHATLKQGKATETAMMLEQRAAQIIADAPAQGIPDGKAAADEALGILDDMLNGAGNTYSKTGFAVFDNHFGGWQRGQLNALVGIPGVAKTALGGQMTFQAASNGQVALWFQMEMSRGEMYFREGIRRSQISQDAMLDNRWACEQIAAIEQKIDTASTEKERQQLHARLNNFRQKVLSEDAIDDIRAKIHDLQSLPIRVDTTGNPDIYHMIAKCREVQNTLGKLDVVYIDNVGLMRSTQGLSKSDGNYTKNLVGELKQLLTPHFPDTAFVVIQHLNASNLKATANRKIQLDQGDLEGQTARHYHQVFALTRPILNKKQLPDIFGEDNWRALSPEDRKEWLEKAIITPVKNRMGNMRIEPTCRFTGHHYNFHSMAVTP